MNKPAEIEAGDTKQPAGTPPSNPPESRKILFQNVESSMNLAMVVRADFDSSPDSAEMNDLCSQVSTIYRQRLGIPASVSSTLLHYDEAERGFEGQVKTCRESLTDELIKNEIQIATILCLILC